MKTTSIELLENLPELETMLGIADEIAKVTVEKLSIERDIKARESKIVLETMSNPLYFVGGKPPSMAFIASTYLYTGIKDELLELRSRLADAIAEEARLKSRLDLLKEFFNMWRSMNASERITNV